MENNNEININEEENENSRKKRTLKNILMIAFSNGITALSGILAGFLIPKIMGEYDYAYYRTFTLYSSYIGLLHFGICDGIYLKYAGCNYEQLDKSKFGSFTRAFYIIETIISLLTVLFSVIFLSGYYRIIIILIGVNILAVNVTTYYELLSQATSRFKLVSMRNVVRACISVISIVTLIALYYLLGFSPDYFLYSSIVVGINIGLALWYLITYREITFNRKERIRNHLSEIKSFYKIGIILLLANFISQLIFIADQQCVKILFSDLDFGQYSFAYTMVNLLIIATSAISTVIYPTISKSDTEQIKVNYSTLNSYLLIFMFLAILIYFPLYWFINFFLPNYSSSLVIFRLILPGVVISSCITVIKANIYKKFNHIARFLIISIIILLISIVANIIAYLLWESMLSISIASIITHFIWYVATEAYLVYKYSVKWIKNFIYMIIMIAIYYTIYLISNVYLSGFVYLLAFITISILLYKKELIDAANIFKKKKRKNIQLCDNSDNKNIDN